MNIKIFEENNIVYFKIGEEKKQFNYDNLDNLIDQFSEENEKPSIQVEGESIDYYKDLLEQIYEETKTNDFIEANNKYKNEITKEQIETELNNTVENNN